MFTSKHNLSAANLIKKCERPRYTGTSAYGYTSLDRMLRVNGDAQSMLSKLNIVVATMKKPTVALIFRGYFTHISRDENLNFSWFCAPRVHTTLFIRSL